jgi:hypothetical protein
MTNGVVISETASGSTCPLIVQSEPFTTFVVMPAVDGSWFIEVGGGDMAALGVTLRSLDGKVGKGQTGQDEK